MSASEPPRSWTLEGARAVFPEVRVRTERAAGRVDELLAGRPESALEEDSELRSQVEDVISQWVRAMEALGAEVKGLWLVDFDTGSGYLCWKWPEPALEHFHTYEEGFAGRSKIQ